MDKYLEKLKDAITFVCKAIWIVINLPCIIRNAIKSDIVFTEEESKEIRRGKGIIYRGSIYPKKEKDEEKGKKLLDRLESRYGRDGANSPLQGIVEEQQKNKNRTIEFHTMI